MLMLAAMIWGSAFVAQKSGADLMGPIAFNGVRILIGGIVLLPVISIMDRIKGGKNAGGEDGAAMPMTKEEAPNSFALLLVNENAVPCI